MRWRNIGTGGYKSRLSELKKMPAHDLLGVAQGASMADLKAAYVRLVRALHPDQADEFMAPYNQEVLKLVNAAYESLRKRNR